MQPFENAFVPYGANKRVFAVRKAGGNEMRNLPKLESLEQALTTFQEVVTVMKSGVAIDDAAAVKLTEQLDTIADCILPTADVLPANADGKTLKQLLEKICKDLSQLAIEAQASDYALGDRTDALLADAQLARDMADQPQAQVGQLAEPVPAAAPAVEAATPAADPPEVEPEVKPAPAPAAEAAATPAPEVAAIPPAAIAAVVESAAAVEPPKVEPAVAAVPQAPALDPRYATKEDITSMTAQVKAMLTEALKPMQELKSALSTAPAVRPLVAGSPKARESYTPMEMQDMAMSPDLAMVDEYGFIKE
jgi:hypothetical protein